MEHEKQSHSAGAARQGGNTSDKESPVLAQAGVRAELVGMREALQSMEMALIGYTHQNDVTKAALAKCRAALATPSTSFQTEPMVFDDFPEFNAHAMGCGLEDRGITDRYEAMRYGFEEALDLVDERIKNFLSDFAAPTTPAQVPAAEVRAQVLHTLNRDGWKIDGSLIYRLSDKGVNCDEINITMVNGSRAAEVRHDAAVELLAELSSTADKASEVRAAEEWPTAVDILAEDLENIAGQWEGCIFQAPAQDIDIGAALRAEFAKIDLSAICKLAAPSTADSGNTSALGEGAGA